MNFMRSVRLCAVHRHSTPIQNVLPVEIEDTIQSSHGTDLPHMRLNSINHMPLNPTSPDTPVIPINALELSVDSATSGQRHSLVLVYRPRPRTITTRFPLAIRSGGSSTAARGFTNQACHWPYDRLHQEKPHWVGYCIFLWKLYKVVFSRTFTGFDHW